MTNPQCPRTYDGRQCQLPSGHPGPCRFQEAIDA